MHVGQALDAGSARPRACGDENLLASHRFAMDLHRAIIDNFCVAFSDRELPAGQALVFLCAIAVDDFVLLLDEAPEIQPDLRRYQPWIAWIPCLMNDLRSLDQIFGRQTATIYAGSAGRAFLGHDRGLAKLLGPQGSGEGGRSGAEDNQVIVVLCHYLGILKSFDWFFSTEQPNGVDGSFFGAGCCLRSPITWRVSSASSSGDINIPGRPPGLLIEVAIHHGNHLGQPLITDILGAED